MDRGLILVCLRENNELEIFSIDNLEWFDPENW